MNNQHKGCVDAWKDNHPNQDRSLTSTASERSRQLYPMRNLQNRHQVNL